MAYIVCTSVHDIMYKTLLNYPLYELDNFPNFLAFDLLGFLYVLLLIYYVYEFFHHMNHIILQYQLDTIILLVNPDIHHTKEQQIVLVMKNHIQIVLNILVLLESYHI
uniref:Uncharacterized protein n=1 Tax=Cryptosporidium parvum TaxID=5807 RepID=F0X6G0_CRYPV